MRRIIRFLLALMFVFLIASPASAKSEVITGNEIGEHDEFDYELWRDEGNASMTLNEGGAFKCVWDESQTNNVLFRTGKKFDETKTHDQIGNISLSYGCDYEPDGNSYLCLYGWSVDPLVEFYVVDAWGTWRPPGAKSKGTIEIDGGTYDVYETTRTNQPSIKGNTTFQQYWSVRTDKKTEGTISVSEHFKAWEDMDMNLGKLYEVALCVEGYQSSGTANVYSNMLAFGDTTIGAVSPSVESAESDDSIESNKNTATEVTDENSKSSASDSDHGVGIYIYITLGVLVIGAGGVMILRKSRQ